MKHLIKLSVAAALAGIISTGAVAQNKPFGGADDVAFAKKLWSVLADNKLVGPNRIHTQPFEGSAPHGGIQQVLSTNITVDGRTAQVLVKSNHMGKDLGVGAVFADPNKFLDAYTVMFKREAGYDAENKDWFWAKYRANGDQDKTPTGVAIAGRFMKGGDKGCIACHKGAGGEDMITLTEN